MRCRRSLLVLAAESWHNQRVQASWRTAAREELIAELERQARENERLRRELEHERDRHRQDRERMRKKIDRLEDELDEARRALHRQAAPFSREIPRHRRRRPGRKPGAAYGRKAHRPIPRHVDERHVARCHRAVPIVVAG